MVIRENGVAGNAIIVNDLPADMDRRDRRKEAADRLLVSRYKALRMRGAMISRNGRSFLVLAGSIRSVPA